MSVRSRVRSVLPIRRPSLAPRTALAVLALALVPSSAMAVETQYWNGSAQPGALKTTDAFYTRDYNRDYHSYGIWHTVNYIRTDGSWDCAVDTNAVPAQCWRPGSNGYSAKAACKVSPGQVADMFACYTTKPW